MVNKEDLNQVIERLRKGPKPDNRPSVPQWARTAFEDVQRNMVAEMLCRRLSETMPQTALVRLDTGSMGSAIPVDGVAAAPGVHDLGLKFPSAPR